MALRLGRLLDAVGKKIINLAPGTATGDAVNYDQLVANSISDRDRNNHTGTQTASTISDFVASVRSQQLDQLTPPAGPLNLNSQRAINLADPTGPQDGATKNYVDTQLSGVASGMDLKGAVKSAYGANVTIANPGAAAFDGVAYSNGEVILLYGQTSAAQNGPWVFNGSAAAMTRPSNFASSAQAVLGSFWVVEQSGTAYKQGDSFAIMANDTAVTLGTTALSFIFVNPLGAVVTGAAVDTGGAAAVTLYHGLGTRDVLTEVYLNSSPWDTQLVEVQRPDLNNIIAVFDAAPAAAAYRALVRKAV